MVPVGGSIIAGFDSKLIETIGKMYPGLYNVVLEVNSSLIMAATMSNCQSGIHVLSIFLFIYFYDLVRPIALKLSALVSMMTTEL